MGYSEDNMTTLNHTRPGAGEVVKPSGQLRSWFGSRKRAAAMKLVQPSCAPPRGPCKMDPKRVDDLDAWERAELEALSGVVADSPDLLRPFTMPHQVLVKRAVEKRPQESVSNRPGTIVPTIGQAKKPLSVQQQVHAVQEAARIFRRDPLCGRPAWSFQGDVVKTGRVDALATAKSPIYPVDSLVFFTDASIKDKKAGAAVVYKRCPRDQDYIRKAWHLQQMAKSHECENWAIGQALTIALQEIHHRETVLREVIVYTDSASALQDMDSTKIKSPFLEGRPGLEDTLLRGLHLHYAGVKVTLRWCPAHCGVPGNGEADTLAGRACSFVPQGSPIAFKEPRFSKAPTVWELDVQELGQVASGPKNNKGKKKFPVKQAHINLAQQLLAKKETTLKEGTAVASVPPPVLQKIAAEVEEAAAARQAGSKQRETTAISQVNKQEDITAHEKEEITIGEKEQDAIGEKEKTAVSGEEEITVSRKDENMVGGKEENTTGGKGENTAGGEDEITAGGNDENVVGGKEENTASEKEKITTAGRKEEIAVTKPEQTTTRKRGIRLLARERKKANKRSGSEDLTASDKMTPVPAPAPAREESLIDFEVLPTTWSRPVDCAGADLLDSSPLPSELERLEAPLQAQPLDLIDLLDLEPSVLENTESEDLSDLVALQPAEIDLIDLEVVNVERDDFSSTDWW